MLYIHPHALSRELTRANRATARSFTFRNAGKWATWNAMYANREGSSSQTRPLRWHLAIDRCRSLQPHSSRHVPTCNTNDLPRRAAYIAPFTRIRTPNTVCRNSTRCSELVSFILLFVQLPYHLKYLPTSIAYMTRFCASWPHSNRFPFSEPLSTTLRHCDSLLSFSLYDIVFSFTTEMRWRSRNSSSFCLRLLEYKITLPFFVFSLILQIFEYFEASISLRRRYVHYK